eukprot:5777540-Lingulodinium_polyedra.AAC.1
MDAQRGGEAPPPGMPAGLGAPIAPRLPPRNWFSRASLLLRLRSWCRRAHWAPRTAAIWQS